MSASQRSFGCWLARWFVAVLAAFVAMFGPTSAVTAPGPRVAARDAAGGAVAFAYDAQPNPQRDGFVDARRREAWALPEATGASPGFRSVIVGSTCTTLPAHCVATNTGQFWPDTPEELDAMVGITGKRVPDGPTTQGRGKVIWDLPNGTRITYEAHPYHTDAPAYHREPHYHVDPAGAKSHTPGGRRLPGDPFDC